MVCGGDTGFYFSKQFDAYGLMRVDYHRCPICRFAYSKTHFDMTNGEWERINHAYHSAYQGGEGNPDDPRWVARIRVQAEVLSEVASRGLIPTALPWLDFGSGDGKLSVQMADRGHRLLNFDRYLPAQGTERLGEDELKPKNFSFVISTSVFEHVRSLEPLDEMVNLLAAGGVLGVHTMVCEEVPQDPNWFYLLPVHVAFFSNDSMQRLFARWGFSHSLYHVEARLWLFFPRLTDTQVGHCRDLAEQPGFFFASRFVDYWK